MPSSSPSLPTVNVVCGFVVPIPTSLDPTGAITMFFQPAPKSEAEILPASQVGS